MLDVALYIRGNFKIPMVIRGPGVLDVNWVQNTPAGGLLLRRFRSENYCLLHPYNASFLLKAAIRDDNPVLFFEHVLLYNLKENLPEEEYLPLDKVVCGKDRTLLFLLTLGCVTMQCKVKTLEKNGYDPEVIDLISLKPLDFETISLPQCINSSSNHIVEDENWGYWSRIDCPRLTTVLLN